MQNIIIAGNGPSLKTINYQRLPKEYDVFRCNQFYFEDKYHLGKNIKAVFFNPGVFLEQYHTTKQLQFNNEYTIDKIICSTFKLPFIENDNFINKFYDFFPDAKLGYEIIENLKEFYAYIKYNEIYFNKRITSGIYMCAIAIALGYKNIYLCGIDFYEGENIYAFKAMSENIKKLFPYMINFKPSNCHSKEYDIQVLKLLKSLYSVNIYTLCDHSTLANYFPLSAYANNDFILENRYDNCINDILLAKDTPGINFYQNQLPINIETTILSFENIINSKNNQIHNLNETLQTNNEILITKENLLYFQTQHGTAKQRIQNQLSYKLGQAMIINSKNVLNYILLPFILISIVISHKQEQKAYQFKIKKYPSLKLPPLETYPDYNEAIKFKNHLSYKLGKEFIKASKTWYRGGVYQIFVSNY
ncbi:alpha-2,3-sialyltransferase [Campylobacter hepaticus]|uniref:alpha-2,3-sialyltransferase n=1 Tax=Campylobacter hepaticus TaxID=1813019 RepID=UPI001FAD66D9|nr:alpha-2,3-sialyltransferase [Campylobacter hepaticus]MCZ0771909.1 alpha-2,3-sialyltransferase [Campylobacter hepaticus]MCZ0773378.1 alpha-2,3-sialyltransferase [Campylobacter hepaticus]WAP49292.1 alpha-2,3-sialyltransferase [Campylobacter hepaticus]